MRRKTPAPASPSPASPSTPAPSSQHFVVVSDSDTDGDRGVVDKGEDRDKRRTKAKRQSLGTARTRNIISISSDEGSSEDATFRSRSRRSGRSTSVTHKTEEYDGPGISNGVHTVLHHLLERQAKLSFATDKDRRLEPSPLSNPLAFAQEENYDIEMDLVDLSSSSPKPKEGYFKEESREAGLDDSEDYDYHADDHLGGEIELVPHTESWLTPDVDFVDLMNISYRSAKETLLTYQRDMIRDREERVLLSVSDNKPATRIHKDFTHDEMAIIFAQVAKATQKLEPVDWDSVSKIVSDSTGYQTSGSACLEAFEYSIGLFNKTPIRCYPDSVVHLNKMSIPGLLSLRERGRGQAHVLKDSLLLRRTKEYACATTFNYSSGSVVDMAFKSSTMKLAVANVTTQDFYNRPGNLLLCDFNKGLTRHLQGHEISGATPYQRQTVTVNDIKLSHSERFFISGANDNKTMIWDVETGRHLNTVGDYRSPVNRIAIMENPKYGEDIFATCSGDGVGVVNIYSLGPEGKVLANNKQLTAPGGKRYISSISFGYGHYWDCLAAGFEGTDNGLSNDGIQGQVAFYDANTLRRVTVGELGFRMATSTVTPRSVSCLSFSRTGRILVCGTSGRTNAGDEEQGDGIVRIFDVHRGKVVQSANSGHLDVNIVDTSPCENYIISCSHQNDIAVFDRRFLKTTMDDALHRFQHENKHDGDANAGITSALWWPEGRGTSESMFITSGGDGAVRLWDIRRATEDAEIWSFDANLGPIARMTCSPSLEHLVIGADTGAVSLFTLDHSFVSGFSDRPMALLTDPEVQ